MAILEDALKGGNIMTGLAIGVGMAVLAPVVRPILRPVAKTVMRAGIAAYDQGRIALAELSEQAGDMVAEVRADMEDEEALGATEHKRQDRSTRRGRRDVEAREGGKEQETSQPSTH